ncbi:MAG: choice-of-anchor J domain-containing protein, partial [Flavobacteriales bacterium]|nr:choice-of-anchor J domain-containing protein [Flavobacteriales bacterium]
MRKTLLFAAVFTFTAFSAFSQCTDWVDPSPTTGWTDFGEFPCDEGTEEITGFQIWQSEAYAFGNAVEGSSYTFSHCNGVNPAETWIPEYTIIAPSGAIDNFGPGDGDGCSITWTASETGAYLVVINEADACGVAGTDSNGFPMITTNSGGEECPEGVAPPAVLEGAETFDDGVLPTCWTLIDADGDGVDWRFLEGVEGFENQWAIFSESYGLESEEVLTPDNYLISPLLEMGDGPDSLFYTVRSLIQAFAAENYSVLVSTTGNEIADFTDEVFTEVLASADWEGRNIDMSAYSNQSIYIAFRHHNVSDELAMLLDAIALPGEAVDCTVSTEDETNISSNFSLFPNPSNGVVNLVNSGDTETYQVRVFDITGKVVKQELVNMATGANHEINLSGNAPGLYTVQFTS